MLPPGWLCSESGGAALWTRPAPIAAGSRRRLAAATNRRRCRPDGIDSVVEQPDGGQLLDVAHERPLAGIAEGDRDAGGAGPRRAADAVYIALGDIRDLV